MLLVHVAGGALLGLAGCAGGDDAPGSDAGVTVLDAEALQDPQACASCHPDHVREWSGSMHAYASDDPVFLAMNARAQRETNGAVGSFCVNCHAPMAVRTGATQDGLNLETLPPFCTDGQGGCLPFRPMPQESEGIKGDGGERKEH